MIAKKPCRAGKHREVCGAYFHKWFRPRNNLDRTAVIQHHAVVVSKPTT